MNDFILIILILIVPLIAQIGVTSSYNKYKQKQNTKGITGQEVAREMLDKNGLSTVHVVETKGNLSDHYDPSRKVVRLSHDIYHGTSVAALAIAAHEVGHAIQDSKGYIYMRIRSFIFPVVNIATQFSYIVILIGFIAQAVNLIYVGIALTALGLLFQIITLPVEFDASKRAKEELKKLGLSQGEDESGIAKMLGAAAMTYVAGVLASALQILRLVLATRD